MRPVHTLELLTLVILIATVQQATTAGEAEQPEHVAPGKFIPTFAVKYGGTPGWPPVKRWAVSAKAPRVRPPTSSRLASQGQSPRLGRSGRAPSLTSPPGTSLRPRAG